MNENLFEKLMKELVSLFGSLALTLKSDMTPYQAVNVIRDSRILTLLPDNVTFSVGRDMDGTLLVKSRYFTFDELENQHKEKVFRFKIKSTPETEKTAAILEQINVNSWRKADRYLHRYDDYRRFLIDATCNVEAFSINGGSEKIYAFFPYQNQWVKEPCVLYMNEKTTRIYSQFGKINVPYETIADDLSEVRISLRDYWKWMAIEEALPIARDISYANNYHEHELSVFSDDAGYHVFADNCPVYENVTFVNSQFNCIEDMLSLDAAEMATLRYDETVSQLLKSGPYTDITIADCIFGAKKKLS